MNYEIKGLTAKQKKLYKIFIFLMKLLILVIPLYLLIWLNLDLTFFREQLALQTQWLLRLIGIEAERVEYLLVLPNNFLFFIEKDCLAWKSLLFLSALIIATPSPIKKKGVGLLLAIPGLYIINLFRLVMTAYYASHFPETVWLMHDIGWQFGLLLSVLLMWSLWIKFYLNNKII